MLVFALCVFETVFCGDGGLVVYAVEEAEAEGGPAEDLEGVN